MRIGPHLLEHRLLLAPMAGVSDRPFRQICRQLGAAMMVSADTTLWGTRKSLRRLDFRGEPGPVSVQILGAEPRKMAEAARINADLGARIIDINMGCPAKKVCRVVAGSALLRDERLVGQILEAVVEAVDIPVTLKIRTGWDHHSRNALEIARIAESAGIQALAVHGRTRADGFSDNAEYQTIAHIKAHTTIPVIANGDIDSPQKAQQVLDTTGADGLMIGRAARGRPWIFQEIAHFLAHGESLPAPSPERVAAILHEHLQRLHAFHGARHGVRVARKHIAWYNRRYPGGATFRKAINQADCARLQLEIVKDFFQQLTERELAA
ncbi:MAG: tRNA dihydrouridine synthase DusB [Candidatus Sedimenticola endophacoides]